MRPHFRNEPGEVLTVPRMERLRLLGAAGGAALAVLALTAFAIVPGPSVGERRHGGRVLLCSPHCVSLAGSACRVRTRVLRVVRGDVCRTDVVRARRPRQRRVDGGALPRRDWLVGVIWARATEVSRSPAFRARVTETPTLGRWPRNSSFSTTAQLSAGEWTVRLRPGTAARQAVGLLVDAATKRPQRARANSSAALTRRSRTPSGHATPPDSRPLCDDIPVSRSAH
jgi:hypothetical protein